MYIGGKSKIQIVVLNLSQDENFVWIASSTASALVPTTIALGNFDGVHRGHQRVIRPILHSCKPGVDSASPDSPVCGRDFKSNPTYSTVVTFNPHPKEFFSGQPRTLLTPLDEKVQQLQRLGVQQLVLLPFDRELAALSPEDFVEKILVQQLQCQSISVGQDFHFGRKRTGTASDLKLLAAKYNIPVNIVPLQTSGQDNFVTDSSSGSFAAALRADRISSSWIRQSLESGDISHANELLGRPYTLVGSVVKGQQLGRTLGFPTANLQLPKEKFLPRHGVYAVRVKTVADTPDHTQGNTIYCPGVMNIGCRPTVNGTYPSVEVHLLDWSGDLYDKKLAVELEKFLRPEQKFPSLEALKTQIQLDCITAKAVLNS
jgi:riboflavin kinase/FMN adenylyltransferase